jgi:hypothetical protein
MNSLLRKLGVPREVQAFFQPFYSTDPVGNLVFSYHDTIEHYGYSFHLIPNSRQFWIAGTDSFCQVRHVFICSSAMEAISYMTLHHRRYQKLESLLFISTGTLPNTAWLKKELKGKQYRLVFGKDLLGRVSDLKIATGIRGKKIQIKLTAQSIIEVTYRNKPYTFPENQFSLNAFEKASGFRSKIRTYKPIGEDSFLAQLITNYENT